MAAVNSLLNLNNITSNCTWCITGNSTQTPAQSHISIAMRTGISVYYCFIIVASVTCNTALIAVIATCKRLHTMSHLFIVNLAVSNLLTSLLHLPFDIERNLRGGFLHGKFLCSIYQLSFMLSLPLSTINLLLLTLETFITIAYPYRRARYINRMSVTITVMVAYLYAVIYTFFPVLHHQLQSIVVDERIGLCYVNFSLAYIYVFVVINLFVPLIVIIVLNLIIFNIANNHTKQIRSFRTLAGVDCRLLYTEMAQASEAFQPDNKTSNGDNKKRVSFNPDIEMDNLASKNLTLVWSVVRNVRNAVMNAAQQKRKSILSKSSSTLLQNKRHSLASNNSSITFSDRSSIEQDQVILPMIQVKKQRTNSRVSIFTCSIKAAKRIALLVGECIFCWLFYIIIVFINISGKWKDPTWNPTLTEIGMIINCSNLFLNPIIYGLLNPEVRSVIFSKTRRKMSSASYATSETNTTLRRLSSQVESVLRRFIYSGNAESAR